MTAPVPTILLQFDQDRTRLTYHYSGHDFRLNDVESTIVGMIIA